MKKLVILGAAALAAWGYVSVNGPAAALGTKAGAAITTTAHGGTLSCSGLERLWEQAGGSPRSAFLAAEIAMAESGGRQYATDTNGGRSTDRGYWQINDAAWGGLSTYSAAGNARAAVRISRDGTNWGPWVTYNDNLYQGKC